MRRFKILFCLSFYKLILFYTIPLFSQITRPVSVHGYIKDSETGETLIGCHIVDSATNRGVISNTFGFFSLVQNAGHATLTVHYIGYQSQSVRLNATKDTTLNILLKPQPVRIGEVVIQGSKASDAKLTQPQMGVLNLNSKEIRSMPAFLGGEADVMRAIQVMPGIQAANERSTGISVRGGSIDQNLILLDDAPVFQISHMMGFYSVFNNDAVKDIKIYKGDMPANYGGRVSSVVDIRLKDGNMQKFSMSGGIGLVSANLSIEGPIAKDRASFIVSGKYGYIGQLYRFLLEDLEMSFYDLNVKMNVIINNKNRIYLSAYNGGDKDDIQRSKYNNNTLSLRWNHVYHPRLFSNISFIYSNYMFTSEVLRSGNNVTWSSGIRQATLKAEYNYFISDKNTLDFGASATLHHFVPGRLKGNQEAKDNITQSIPFSNRIIEEQGVLDYALYVSNQQKLTDRFSLRYGIRANLYQNLGGHWVYELGNDYQVADSFYVDKGKTYAGYFNIEPRISLNYRVFKNSAVKASYTYTTQQAHLLQKTNGGGLLDIWFPSGINTRPQTSSQYSLGFVQYLFNNSLEASVEGYYKDMNHIIDYKDEAILSKSVVYAPETSNYNFEEQLRAGKGYAYGIELVVKGDFGKIDGFVNYTYARSKRKIPDVNNNRVYLSPFDKPHTFDLFLNYNISKRVSVAANLRLQSGQVTTMPVYVMEIYGKAMMGYSNRNEYRLPYYQRLDLSLTWKNREKPGRRWRSEWNFSVLNALNHANLNYINFIPAKDNPSIINAAGVYMISILPSVSWRFYL